MEIGVLGVNPLAISLIEQWINRGHLILLHESNGTAGPGFHAKTDGRGVQVVPSRHIQGRAEIIVIALRAFDPEMIASLGEVRHRIVVDLIDEARATTSSSSYSRLQQMFPCAKLVKVALCDPMLLSAADIQIHALYCYSHDQLAQRTVKRLLTDAGFSVVDLTSIK